MNEMPDDRSADQAEPITDEEMQSAVGGDAGPVLPPFPPFPPRDELDMPGKHR